MTRNSDEPRSLTITDHCVFLFGLGVAIAWELREGATAYIQRDPSAPPICTAIFWTIAFITDAMIAFVPVILARKARYNARLSPPECVALVGGAMTLLDGMKGYPFLGFVEPSRIGPDFRVVSFEKRQAWMFVEMAVVVLASIPNLVSQRRIKPGLRDCCLCCLFLLAADASTFLQQPIADSLIDLLPSYVGRFHIRNLIGTLPFMVAVNAPFALLLLSLIKDRRRTETWTTVSWICLALGVVRVPLICLRNYICEVFVYQELFDQDQLILVLVYFLYFLISFGTLWLFYERACEWLEFDETIEPPAQH